MHRRMPVGFDGELTMTEGVAPYAGSRVPGPMSPVTTGATNSARERPHAGDVEDSFVGSDAPADSSISFPFEVDADFYRLRRVDADRRYSFNETPLAPEQAAAILERAVEQHRRNERLLRVLHTAMRQLAGLHDNGIFLVLRLRPETRTESAVAPPPRPPAPRPPVLSAPPAIPEPMMPIAQAAVLRDAAATGVPFCEECARAAEERRAATAATHEA